MFYELVCLDMGSSSVKGTIYTDYQKGGQIKEISKFKVRHKHKDFIDSDGFLTQEGIDKGTQLLLDIKTDYGLDCNKMQCMGIATSWARTIKNATKEIVDFANNNLRMNITVLSQVDEGKRAFKVVEQDLILHGISTEKLIVLDAGGGSYQVNYKIADTVVMRGDEFALETTVKNRFGGKLKLLDHNEIAIARDMVFNALNPILHNITEDCDGNPNVWALGNILTGWPHTIKKQNFISKNQAIELATTLSTMPEVEADQAFPGVRIIPTQYGAIFADVLMEILGVNKMNLASHADFCLGAQYY